MSGLPAGLTPVTPQKPPDTGMPQGLIPIAGATPAPKQPASPAPSGPPSPGMYSHDQLKRLWTQYGGDPHVADLMAHVAQAESSGHPSSEGSYVDRDTKKRYYVRGLWQISTIHGNDNWFDPVKNVKKAIELYNAAGMSPWEDSRNKGGTEAGAKAGGWGQYQSGDFARGIQGSHGEKPGGASGSWETPPKLTPRYAGLPPGLTALPKGLTPIHPPTQQQTGAPQSQAPVDSQDPLGIIPPIVEGEKTVLSKALDAQGYQVRKAVTGEANTANQMTKIRHAIPGMDWLYQARMPNTGITIIDRVQDMANHASQGLIDSAIQTALDPLSYETAGFGAVEKAFGKPVGGLLLKALDSTPLSRKVYDLLNFGGEVARERGTATMQTIRGAGNRASAQGAMAQTHIMERVKQIFDGSPIKNVVTGKVTPGVKLTDYEKERIGKALNGEMWDADLSPQEHTAYRQLRTLTALDYHLRTQTALTVALKGNIADPVERAEVAKYFASGKEPVIPEPEARMRKSYGEPVPRSRTTKFKPPPDVDAEWAKATEGVTPQEKSQLGKALTHPEIAQNLPPLLKQRLEAVQEALRQKFSLAGGDEVTELDPKQRYTNMPANQAEIERMTRVKAEYDKVARLVQEKVPFREDYMPFKHHTEPAPEGREASTVNPTEYYDPRAQQREDVKVTSPDQLMEGFEAMARNTNRQVTTKALHESLGNLLDDPKINKLFEEVIGPSKDKRTDTEQLKDMWLSVIGYPRAATVSLTPRHAANILDLLVNTVPPQKIPLALGRTMKLAAQLVAASPKEYASLTKAGRELGAISGNFVERKPFFQKIPILNKWTALNNKLVWAVDEAAKQTYAQMLVDSGEAKELQAGGMASERLVDYEHLSPLQKALRFVAPFGTFRGGIPQAVLGGIARNPARAAFLSRATGGTMYGDKPQAGQPGAELYMPTADVGRAMTISEQPNAPSSKWHKGTSHKWKKGGSEHMDSGPADFFRATIGAPIQAALGAGQDVLQPGAKPAHWAMYGQPWTPQRDKNGQLDLGFLIDSALAGVPEAGTILESLGLSRYKWKGLAKEILRQTAGVSVSP